MKLFIKLFVIILIRKSINCEVQFCKNEHSNCSVNENMSSDSEVIDLNSLIKHATQYLKSLNQKYESKINAISSDIGYIKNNLQIEGTQDENCFESAEKSLNIENIDVASTKSNDPTLYSQVWVIIQRRQDGSINFYRSWDYYKRGFGNPFREYFIGLDRIHYLTNSTPHELLIQLEDFYGNLTYALYDEFLVGDESEKYQLKKLGAHSGDTGDYMRSHEGMFFSTKDRDNDARPDLHCAKRFQGGWWYNNCLTSHLNGPYRTRYKVSEVGITWGKYDEMQVKTVQMMIRSKKTNNNL